MSPRPRPRPAGALVAALALMVGGCGLFGGDDEVDALTADLSALNTSDAAGSVSVDITDSTVTVAVAATGLSPDLPHAQHLHIGGGNECPAADDTGDDEVIDTAEGQESYGEIRISLTTEGDMGPDSGLAVDRFPVASPDGAVTYSRTFDLPADVTTEDLQDAVFVQHGIADLVGDPAQYDGDFDSPLNPDLPLEATLPALCGALDAG